MCQVNACLSSLAFLALASSSACLHASAFEYGDGDIAGHYFTYPHPTGNRIIDSSIKGTFPDNVQQIDVEMPADVTWAVGTHHPVFGFKFVVTTADNKAYCVHPPTETGKPATMEEIKGAQLAADQPPLVRHIDGKIPSIVTFPNVSPLSHPVPAGDGAYAFIDTAGDLVLWGTETNKEIGRLPGINALTDGRIVRSEDGHLRPWLALYAGATEYKDGCKLGDCIEGTRLLVLKVHPQLGTIDIMADVQLEGDDVFEGISPMFLPDDSVVATVSNPTDGVSVRMYNPNDGFEISKSDIADAFRHQLFYNDFGTSAKPLPYLVDLHGPHSDQRKEMQFMSLSSPSWSIDKTIGQYNTQPVGTRYVDTNVSGDLNGDGIAEAVVPSRYRARIVSVQIDARSGEPKELWSLNLPKRKKMGSNLAAVGSDTGIALGAASGNIFRMWMPPLDGAAISSKAPTKQTSEEQQLEDLLSKVKSKEKKEEKEVSGLLVTLISFLSIAMVLVAYRLKKRRASRKEMDTLIHDPSSVNIAASRFAFSRSPLHSTRSIVSNFGFDVSPHNNDNALDASSPVDNMEDYDDEDDEDGSAVFDVQLDRDDLVPEVI